MFRNHLIQVYLIWGNKVQLIFNLGLVIVSSYESASVRNIVVLSGKREQSYYFFCNKWCEEWVAPKTRISLQHNKESRINALLKYLTVEKKKPPQKRNERKNFMQHLHRFFFNHANFFLLKIYRTLGKYPWDMEAVTQ